MKTKINNSCGKKSGCCADIQLPHGTTVHQVTDNSSMPKQSS